MLDEYRLHRDIICIDFKSFFATVECNERGLNPFTTPLVVSDNSRGDGAITLAASPFIIAKHGVKSRQRLWELDKTIPNLIIAKPSMHKYLEVSTRVIDIYLRYVSRNDMYIYSIDEVFIDLTDYLKMYGKTAYEMANVIMGTVYRETKIYSTCGIGPNMVLAKYALDIEAKHNKDWIAVWDYTSFKEKMWHIKDLKKMWGIGPGSEKSLHKLGIMSVGDIAKSDPQFLYDELGIRGEELYLHSNGIDVSRIQDQTFKSIRKSIGVAQTMFEDYFNDDAITIILEMVFDLGLKLTELSKQSSVVHLSIGYSRKSDYPGFSRQMKLQRPSSDYRTLFKYMKILFEKFYKRNEPIRKIQISFAGLKDTKYEQTNLFEKQQRDVSKLDDTIIKLRHKYGKNAILLGVSKNEEATSEFRNTLIGGHNS